MAQLVSIKYKIGFNYDNDPKDFTFTDIVAAAYNTTYGLTLANIKGIIKVVSPSGVTVYINTGGAGSGGGYANDDFSYPDIDGNTSDWEQDLGSLPLDSDGEVELGEYTFYYKLSTDGGTTVYNSADNEKSYNLSQYVAPVVDIDLTQSCRTSELTSTDNTDYAVQIDNDTIDPTLTRAHKIVKPEGAGCTLPVTASTTEQIRILGGGGTADTDIWTGIWQTTITSTLVYDLALWGTDVWIQINDEVSGYDHTDVLCSDCLCDIRTCLDTLYSKWQNAIGVESRNRVEELKVKNIMATANFMLYEVYERCGECSSAYCDNLADILSSEDCTCAASTDDVSQRVVAWGNSTGTGSTPLTPSAWLNGTADPSAGLGANGDYYLQTGTGITGIEGNVYYKAGGAWALLMNIVGATGAGGSTGGYWSVLTAEVVDNKVTSPGTEQVLKTVSVPLGTMASGGDSIVITSIFKLAQVVSTKTLRVYFGGVQIGEYVVTSTPNGSNEYVHIRAEVMRDTSTTQLSTCEFSRVGIPGSSSGPQITEITGVDLTSAQAVEISGESSPGLADSIIGKNFKVVFEQTIY